MTPLYRLRLRLGSLRHRLLCFLSPDFRSYASQASTLSALRSELATARADLANSQTALLGARSEIQTLTASTRNASDLAVRLRDELNDSRKRENRALRLALKSSQCTADWLARQTVARAPIYGVGPAPPAPEPAPADSSVSVGRVHARAMASAQNAKFIAEMESAIREGRIMNSDSGASS